jgi:cell shape-determining protein MreC
MRNRKTKRANRKLGIFVGLLALSVVAMFLPSRYTSPLISLVQPLLPFQAMAHQAVNAIDDAIAGPDTPMVTSVEFDEVLRAKEAAEHRVASQAQRIAWLEAQNQELIGIRNLGLDDRGELIPANVICGDLIGYRRSRIVDKGSVGNVERGAAVVSHHFSVTAGSEDGVQRGLSVLASEVLVGSVVQAGTHTARVRLLTDASTMMAVTIFPRRGPAPKPLDARFILQGNGSDRLEIRDVSQGYIKRNDIDIGDRVMTVGDAEALPVPVTIGTVETIRSDPDNGTLFILDVRPAIKAKELRRVYIVNAMGPAPPQ